MTYNREFTSDFITELKPNEIFVFGSNIGGFHGGGAARVAHKRFGAEWGVGEGITGQCYASDQVHLTLRGKAKDDLDRLCFHFELELPNGTRVGSMFTDGFISVKKGENFAVPMTINLSGLAPDRYIFHAVAETMESRESYVWQDTVANAFILEIIADIDARRRGSWKKKTWGNVRLKDIQINVDE